MSSGSSGARRNRTAKPPLLLLLQLIMIHQVKSLSVSLSMSKPMSMSMSISMAMRKAPLRNAALFRTVSNMSRKGNYNNERDDNNDDGKKRNDTRGEQEQHQQQQQREQQQERQGQGQGQKRYNISLPGDLYRPFFPIYYNDVYEVPLPPRHRFPMSKYRQVRVRVQDGIANAISKNGSDANRYATAAPAVNDSAPAYAYAHTHATDDLDPDSDCDSDCDSAVQLEFIVSPLVTKKDLITTHCEKYVERYLVGDQTELELRNVGFPWSPEGVNRSLSSTGGTVAAALAVCSARREQLNVMAGGGGANENKNGNGNSEVTATSFIGDVNDNIIIRDDNDDTSGRFGPLFAAHVAGGTHHAFRDRGEGFSVFSDIAVAANVVLRDFPDTVSRILIIDLDVHQGNGNAVLFQNDDRVFTFSMHCKGNYFSAKEDSDLDIELPIGCNDETYLATLNHWLKRIRNEAGQFDLIFFQAGVDIIESDRLGRMNITHKGICRRNRMVYKFALDMGIPLVITMGGGYPRKDWEPILRAHTDVYMNAFESIRSFNDQNR